MAYNFDCHHFHALHPKYTVNLKCDYVSPEIADRALAITDGVDHLTKKNKKPVPMEHLYQDTPELGQNVDESIIEIDGA